MIAAIRLRGGIGMRQEMRDTLMLLGLKRVNTLSIIEEKPANKGMVRKVENFIAWGELSEEMKKKIGDRKTIRLKPLKGGMISIKNKYPRGDLGYRGAKINEMIDRMM